MSGYRIFFVLMSVIFFTGCHNDPGKKENNTKTITILVQPFKDIDPNDVEYVVAELKKVYPHIQIKKSIPLPLNAFNADRGRYRADSLIRILRDSAQEGQIMIGLTSMDISTSKGSKADWGIMGLGSCPGKSCVASTFRLSPQYRRVQFFKVAIHELGHTLGLPHCEIRTCLMRDAEGTNPLNQEKEFCSSCRSVLLKKGWHFDRSPVF